MRSLEAFENAIDVADDVGNRFLGGVARVAATSVHARSGEPQRALQAFAGIIDEWRHQGNVTHLVISLRNLAELFARVGALEAAGELLGALQPRSVAAAYGAEAQRLAEAMATLERTAGEHNVARWVARRWASRPARGDKHRPRHDRHVDPHRAHPEEREACLRNRPASVPQRIPEKWATTATDNCQSARANAVPATSSPAHPPPGTTPLPAPDLAVLMNRRSQVQSCPATAREAPPSPVHDR